MHETIFAISAALIGYTYAGYPLIMAALARRHPSPPLTLLRDADCPPVTAVIAVHNEQSRVLNKIADLRAQDYPAERLRIVFVSDGSTDQTNALLNNHPQATLLAYPNRQGKAHAINVAMATITTPVVLLCDVRQQAQPHALRAVVSRLMQPGIGAVSGELAHRDPDNPTAAQIGAYWRYEKWIRQSESAVSSVVGATGAFYAIHRDAFRPIPPDTLLDDFEIPMQIARQGLKVKFESQALVFDELQKDMAGERKRKLRTLSGNFQSFARNPWLFSLRANPIWTQFISHKVLRLVVPYALIASLLSCLLSPAAWMQAFGGAQIGFYALAASPRIWPGLARHRLVSLAHVFTEMNITALEAGLRFWLAGRVARWDKT